MGRVRHISYKKLQLKRIAKIVVIMESSDEFEMEFLGGLGAQGVHLA